MSRYDNVTQAVEATINNSLKTKVHRFVQFGVFDASLASKMVLLAKSLGRTNIEFYGFDMFEDMTHGVNQSEYGPNRLASNREDARKRITTAGAAKVQLIKGDSKLTVPQAVSSVGLAAVVVIDGGASPETIAHDFANALNFSYEKTKIVICNYIPGDLSRGSAFLLKSSAMLSKEYGINLTPVGPIDQIVNDPHYLGPMSVQAVVATCKAQLTPAKLAGLANLLLMEASLKKDPEPQEYVPEKSFVDDTPAIVVEKSPEPVVEAKSEEASAPAGAPFQETATGEEDRGCNTDVQPVRVCENSCGKLPEEHCQRSSGACGRREPGVESGHVGEVSEEQAPPVQVPEERQESDKVVEQGDRAVSGLQVPDNSGGQLGSEVSSELDKGTSKSSRRRRRRSRTDDERSGSQE